MPRNVCGRRPITSMWPHSPHICSWKWCWSLNSPSDKCNGFIWYSRKESKDHYTSIPPWNGCQLSNWKYSLVISFTMVETGKSAIKWWLPRRCQWGTLWKWREFTSENWGMSMLICWLDYTPDVLKCSLSVIHSTTANNQI